MTIATLDDLLDDLFLGCALNAFIEQATKQKGPLDMESTRRRAYQLYEQALASANADRNAYPAGFGHEP